MDRTPARVVVLGGGFGGVYAAKQLERLARKGAALEVTLVSQENFFLFTPMLHEIAASDLDVTHIVSPLRTLLRRTRVFVGSVESIDLQTRRVLVSHGFDRHAHEIEYDHLIIALGSITNFYHLPGLETNALTMKTLGDAIHLRNRVIATLEEADTECASPQDDGRLRRSRFLDGRASGHWAIAPRFPTGSPGSSFHRPRSMPSARRRLWGFSAAMTGRRLHPHAV